MSSAKSSDQALTESLRSAEWALRSLRERTRHRKVTPPVQAKVRTELDAFVARLQGVLVTVPTQTDDARVEAKARCKDLGDRLLAEDRPPTAEELADFRANRDALA